MDKNLEELLKQLNIGIKTNGGNKTPDASFESVEGKDVFVTVNGFHEYGRIFLEIKSKAEKSGKKLGIDENIFWRVPVDVSSERINMGKKAPLYFSYGVQESICRRAELYEEMFEKAKVKYECINDAITRNSRKGTVAVDELLWAFRVSLNKVRELARTTNTGVPLVYKFQHYGEAFVAHFVLGDKKRIEMYMEWEKCYTQRNQDPLPEVL